MNCGVGSFGSTDHQLILISYVCLSPSLGSGCNSTDSVSRNVQARRVVTRMDVLS